MMMWKLQKDCWDIDCVLFHLASRTKLDKREEKYRYQTTLPMLSKKLPTYSNQLKNWNNFSVIY